VTMKTKYEYRSFDITGVAKASREDQAEADRLTARVIIADLEAIGNEPVDWRELCEIADEREYDRREAMKRRSDRILRWTIASVVIALLGLAARLAWRLL
jgi:hypothetical protein